MAERVSEKPEKNPPRFTDRPTKQLATLSTQPQVDEPVRAKGHKRRIMATLVPVDQIDIPEEAALQEIRNVEGIQGATGKGIWVAIGRALSRSKIRTSRQHADLEEANQAKDRVSIELEEERAKTEAQAVRISKLEKARTSDAGEIRDLTKSNRRQFLFILGGLAAGVYFERERLWGAFVDKFSPYPQKPDYPKHQTQDDQPIEERSPEVFKRMTSFETVLTEGNRTLDQQSGIWKDKLLSPFKVSEYLLGDKFIYTGMDNALTEATKGQTNGTNVHNFAIMGSMSRRFGKNGNHKESYKTTTLSDAINNLLDYRRLTDSQIKNWIVYTYYYSFGANLDENLITLTRDPKTNSVVNVEYALPSEKYNEIRLVVPKIVEDLTSDEKGGNITQVPQTFPLVGRDGRLLLHSGISPMHDLRVPSSHMESNKEVDVKNTGIEWRLSTLDIANAINWYKNRLKTVNPEIIHGMVNGRNVGGKSLKQYINENDPFAKELAELLTKDAKTDAQKIQKITSFVQSLRYIWENDSDENRPLLITLFNDGSDCNNLVVAWASMMHALKLDYAILHTSDGKDEAHVMGGIPEDTSPKEFKVNPRYRGIFPVELTDKWPIGQVDPPKNHTIYGEEVTKFPK